MHTAWFMYQLDCFELPYPYRYLTFCCPGFLCTRFGEQFVTFLDKDIVPRWMSSEIYSNLARGTFHQDVVLDMGVILCDSYLRTYTYGIYYVMLTKRINLIIFILSIILIYFCTRENVLKYTSTLKLHVTENVERVEEQSDTESQVISQTKISYTEAGFKSYLTLARSFQYQRQWYIVYTQIIIWKPKKGLLDGQLYSFFGTGDLTQRNITEEEVSNIILHVLKKKHAKSEQIQKKFRRTERWPFNKRWFVGELLFLQKPGIWSVYYHQA